MTRASLSNERARGLIPVRAHTERFMKAIYLLLCVIGTILPLSQFVPWLMDNGLNSALLINEISASRISSFAWLDVIVSAVVVLLFVLVEGRRLGVRNLWAPFVAMFTVGVSLALPLFLLLRQIRLEQRSNNAFNSDAGNAGAG